MENGKKNPDLKTELLERLHDPVQLRLMVAVIMLLIGYLGIYKPLANNMERTKRELAGQKKRGELARDIEFLRGQVGAFQDRLPENTDTTEWVQYVLAGVHRVNVEAELAGTSVELVVVEPASNLQQLGPYKAVALKIELEGEFRHLESFLHWLETNRRMFRVDRVRIAPSSRRQGDKLNMQLNVLGVMR